MTRDSFKSWERGMQKKFRRWMSRPLWTFPWEVKPGRYLPPTSPPRSADEIRALRTAEGLSQRELAAFLDVSVKTVQSWEQGLRRPEGSALRVMQLLDELGKLMLYQACWRPDEGGDEDEEAA